MVIPHDHPASLGYCCAVTIYVPTLDSLGGPSSHPSGHLRDDRVWGCALAEIPTVQIGFLVLTGSKPVLWPHLKQEISASHPLPCHTTSLSKAVEGSDQ